MTADGEKKGKRWAGENCYAFNDININTFLALPMAVASGYSDFSASEFGCQVRLPRFVVASQKGRELILLVLFVEKVALLLLKNHGREI